MLMALAMLMWGGVGAVQLSDNFPGSSVGDNWRIVGQPWAVSEGAARSANAPEGWMVWKGLVAPKSISADVEITPEQGQTPGVWSAAGLGAFLDGNNYWRLALVENATDKNLRYFELVERMGGVWQAQVEEGTRLQQTEQSPEARWDYGHKYRMHLESDGTRISGIVYEGDKVVWRKGFAMPPTVAGVRNGWPAFDAVGMVAAFRGFKAQAGMAQPGGSGAQRRALIIDNNLPGATPAVTAWVQAALKRANIATATMSATEFAMKGVSADQWDVVVLPSAQIVPLGTGLALDAYLRGGGQLIVMTEGVPFEKQLVNDGALWLTPNEAQAAVAADRVAVDVDEALPAKLVHASSRQDNPAVTVESDAKVGGKVLHVKLPVYDGWSTFMTTVRAGTLDAADPMLMFWAKGDATTTHLVIECVDDTGARWIGALPISTEWKRYAVGPNDLPYWPDASGAKHKDTDHVDPAKIVKIGFGLAKSHAPLADGPKEFWLSSLGAGPEANLARPEMKFVPDLEGITPWYKTYDFPGVSEIATADDSAWPQAMTYFSGTVRCGYTRPWGKAMTGEREKRWVPILEARDGQGGRMYPATLNVQTSGPYAGATWVYWGVPAAALPQGGDKLGDLFAEVVRSQMRRVWLVEAGADQVTYMPDQKPRVGARIMNASGQKAQVEVRATVLRNGNAVANLPARNVTIGAMSEASTLVDWKPDAPGVYQIAVELRQGGKVVDRILSSTRVMTGAADKDADFVRVEGGEFRVGPKTWHPHGVNYWPRYVSGMGLGDYWIGWLRRAHYDGDLVEEDLKIAESLGITAMSIAPPGVEADLPCLWDFLERCKAHGIRVNISVPADPRGLDEKQARMIVEKGQLAKFSAVFAFDVVWEPRWGSYEERSPFDAKWRDWVADQYGSLAAAEKLWGCAAPKNDKGEATGPTDDQLTKDSDARVMVAAYRRFVDDFLTAGYGRTWRFLHSIDPKHLISNRAGYGGTGNVWVVNVMQFDPLSGAAYHDFLSPEAYGMEPKDGDYKRWGFVDAYCRWAGNGRPVFWAEYGASIYPGYKPENYDIQQKTWANVMRLVVFAGANGDAGWWWPGGYRVDEKSDYGCMEPYGKPRGSAEELKANAEAICGRAEDARPVKWMTIDRDTDVRGLAGLWEKGLADYLAVADGKTAVRLRTVGDTKSSADVPVEGVGGVKYDGVGPVKWLNAVAHAVSVTVGGKASSPVNDMLWGDIVVDAPAGQATVRLEMMNTGEAAWASKGDGAVRVADETGKVLGTLTADVARYAIGTIEFPLPDGAKLTLQLEAAGRCRFGQKVHLVIKGQ